MSSLLFAALVAVAFLFVLLPFGRLRFLTHEISGHGRQVIGALCLVAVLSLSVFYPAVSSGNIGTVEPDDIWFPSLFAGHLVLTAFLLTWWRLRRRRSLLRFLRLHRSSAADLWLGAQVGLLGWFLTIAAMISVGLATMSLSGEGETAELPRFMFWLVALPVGLKLLIIAAAMTVEEAFFRAFLQPRFGWIPSSLLFAVAHAGYGLPMMLVGVMAISLVIGWVFRRTGRLLPCIVAHGVFDAIQLLIVIPLVAELLERAG